VKVLLLPSAKVPVELLVVVARGAANVTEVVVDAPVLTLEADTDVDRVLVLVLVPVLAFDDPDDDEEDAKASASWALRRSCQTLSCADWTPLIRCLEG
jgi:hypothetical protein